jgi:hypothetical protein
MTVGISIYWFPVELYRTNCVVTTVDNCILRALCLGLYAGEGHDATRFLIRKKKEKKKAYVMNTGGYY